jgi:hypothetical protein
MVNMYMPQRVLFFSMIFIWNISHPNKYLASSLQNTYSHSNAHNAHLHINCQLLFSDFNLSLYLLTEVIEIPRHWIS